MSTGVFANTRAVVGKASGGVSPCAFPDVCFTPPQTPVMPNGEPIPYPNTGFAADTTAGSVTVMLGGQPAMLKNKSFFSKSTGDEAGSAPKKGIITSQIKGKCYFQSWSMDVFIENYNVDREGDITDHNHESQQVANTPPIPHVDAMATGDSGIAAAAEEQVLRVEAELRQSQFGFEQARQQPMPDPYDGATQLLESVGEIAIDTVIDTAIDTAIEIAMSLALPDFSRPPVLNIVRQQVDCAIALGLARLATVCSPQAGLVDLERLDQRLDANLQGIAAAGELGMSLCQAALDNPNAGGIFAAGFSALSGGDNNWLPELASLTSDELDPQRLLCSGLTSAFAWMPWDAIEQPVRQLLSSGESSQCVVGLAACRLHSFPAPNAIAMALSAPDMALQLEAIRSAGELGVIECLPSLLAMVADASQPPALCIAAASSACLLGDRQASIDYLLGPALDVLTFAAAASAVATTSIAAASLAATSIAATSIAATSIAAASVAAASIAAASIAAISIAMRVANDQQAASYFTRLRAEADTSVPALEQLVGACGARGDPDFVPWLIGLMDAPEVQLPAMQAFEQITGVAIANFVPPQAAQAAQAARAPQAAAAMARSGAEEALGQLGQTTGFAMPAFGSSDGEQSGVSLASIAGNAAGALGQIVPAATAGVSSVAPAKYAEARAAAVGGELGGAALSQIRPLANVNLPGFPSGQGPSADPTSAAARGVPALQQRVDPSQMRQWWSDQSANYPVGQKLFYGAPSSIERCQALLATGTQPVRAAAAIEARLIGMPGPLFPVSAPAKTQSMLLQQMQQTGLAGRVGQVVPAIPT